MERHVHDLDHGWNVSERALTAQRWPFRSTALGHHQPWRRLSWALGLRLIASPAVAFALVPAFGFKGEAAAVMVLSSSFPTAVNTALIVQEFKADSHFAAAAVSYSQRYSA